jgi:hypothetical protein
MQTRAIALNVSPNCWLFRVSTRGDSNAILDEAIRNWFGLGEHSLSRNEVLLTTKHPETKNSIQVLKRCTLWSTLKFQRCTSSHITGGDVTRETKEITNATMV